MIGEFRERLKKSTNLLGPLISIDDPSIVETIRNVGPDLLIVDMEHSVIDTKSLQTIMMAAGDTAIIARIRGLEKNEIKKVLDTGVSGIIVPGVMSPHDVELAVQYSKYPPKGIRGAGPGRATGYGYDFASYARTADDLLVIVQIETKSAFENLESMLSVEGLDGFFIGPMDLSISLGIDFSWGSEKFRDSIQRVVAEGQKKHLIGGIYTPLDRAVFENVKSLGLNFIMFGADREAITSRYKEALEQYRKT